MASEQRYVKELTLKFKRRPVPEDSPLGFQLSSPEAVWRVMGNLMDEAQEVFCVLNLNAQNYLQSIQEISRGTLSASLVHPREVFRGAIMANSAHLILIHNHPSGDPTPSQEDIRLTRQLYQCGQLIGIQIHDHVVIGDDRFVSLAMRGLLNSNSNLMSATKVGISSAAKSAGRIQR